jgi:SAM-dependent methyltransferase
MPTVDWSVVAQVWEQEQAHADEQTAALTAGVLAALDLQPGERVLELGCGTGALAARLADAVGPDGAVLASDVAAGMVDVARRTLAPHAQVEVRQLDASATGLADESFDAVVFVMGLMFLEQPAEAVAEIRRVLRPGGRAVVASWAGPEHNPWLACVGMAAGLHGLFDGPPTGPGELFSLAEPDVLATVLGAGGLASAEVEQVEVCFRFPDVESYLATTPRMAAPVAAALAAHPEKEPAVMATAGQLAAAHLTADGLVLPGRALVGRATR